jgi:hypothetical protein
VKAFEHKDIRPRRNAMHTLIVFESMFGNTELIARAIAEGMSARIPVEVVEVGVAPAEIGPEVALLVVGGPTHAFGMSRPQTREDATKQALGHVVSQGQGIREWLSGLTRLAPVPAAAFDTRVSKGWVPGSAARAAKKRLHAMGFTDSAATRSFYVQGVPGPLAEGQTASARQWGEELALGLTITSEETK